MRGRSSGKTAPPLPALHPGISGGAIKKKAEPRARRHLLLKKKTDGSTSAECTCNLIII